MQVNDSTTRFSSSIKELAKRFHAHSNAEPQLASQYKTGVLDVQLLLDAGFTIPAVFNECEVVGVKYAATTFNTIAGRREAVFSVYGADGQFHGHYLSSAFKSLKL